MKKIISLVATIAMMSSMFVSSASAATASNVTLKSDKTSITVAEYNSAMNTSLDENLYDAYKVSVSVSGVGTIESTGIDDGFTGRQINNLTYKIDFDTVDGVYTTKKPYVKAQSKLSLKATEQKWTDADTYMMTFASGQFPGEADEDVSYTDTIENMYVMYFAIEKGKTATATINTDATILYIQGFEYAEPVGAVEKYDNVNNVLNLSPASFTIGEAVTPPPSNEYAFSVAGVEADNDGNYAGTPAGNGVVWANCKMAKFDTNNEYYAIFNAEGETKDARKTLIRGLENYETAGEVTFDAVMWFAGEAKTGVTLRVDEIKAAE